MSSGPSPIGGNLTSSEVTKTALYIDGQNLLSAARELGFKVDFTRLKDFFRQQGIVHRASIYWPDDPDPKKRPSRPLLDWLDYHGYRVVTMPGSVLDEESRQRQPRAVMKVELAVDALGYGVHVDHAIFFAGSRDFRTLIAAIQQQGTRVTVVSTAQTNPPFISDELRRQADAFIDLVDLRPAIRLRN